MDTQKIAKFKTRFDTPKHKEKGVPTLNKHIKAFEKFSGLSSNQYEFKPLDSSILFENLETGVTYEVVTNAGLICFLSDLVDCRSYDELDLHTNHSMWVEIAEDGFNRIEFVSSMLGVWEEYWRGKLVVAKHEGYDIDIVKGEKEVSWCEFQVFMNLYTGNENPISLALSINDTLLYLFSVVTMLELYDVESCYIEYCDLEFGDGPFYGGDEYESVEIGGKNGGTFFIKESHLIL